MLKHFSILLMLLGACTETPQQKNPSSGSTTQLPAAIIHTVDSLAAAGTAEAYAIVSIGDQRLYTLKGRQLLASYIISSATAGTGSEAGSNRTPLGLHEVAEKYGSGAPEGTIFKSRQNTGRIATIYTDSTNVDEDLVTTRILWLRGLEPGKNQGPGIDSYQRYIYIHGTNEEGLLGRPASHGCIRMKNQEVIDLYRLLRKGSVVVIVP